MLIALVALTAGKAAYYAVQRATRPAPIVAAAPASMKVRAPPQRPREALNLTASETKVDRLRPAEEAVVAQSATTEPVGGAGTTAFWKNQVLAALEEQGYDPDSAREVLAMIPIDLNADPQTVAARAAQGM